MGLPGMGKGGKVDMNAFNRNMQQNLRAAKTRDRMRTKLGDKAASANSQPDNSPAAQLAELERIGAISSKGLNPDGVEEFVFSTV